MVVPMLAPTAVTYSTNGRAASAFCADISSGRVDPVADGRADPGTNGGAGPGLPAPTAVPLPTPTAMPLPAPTAGPLPTPGALPVPLVPFPMPTAVPLHTPAVVPQAESAALPFPAIGCRPNGPYWGVGVCLSRHPAHERRLRATGTPRLELWPTHFATQAPPTTDQVRRARVSLRRSPSLWEASHDGQCLSTVGGLPALL